MEFFECLDTFCHDHAPLQHFPWLGFPHEAQQPCSFLQYPTSHGYSESHIRTLRYSALGPDNSGTSRMSTLALLQSWLIFGALEDVLSTRITQDMFVVATERGPMISMKFLRSMILKWILASRKLKPDEQIQIRSKVTDILANQLHWCFMFNTWSKRADWVNMKHVPEPQTVDEYYGYDYALESLARLLTLTIEVVNTAKAILARSSADHFGCNPAYTGPGEVRLLHKLVKIGWCPFMARNLTDVRYSVAEYATFWPDLVPAFEADRHRLCTIEACIGYDVDTETYQPMHVCLHGDCKTISSSSLLSDVLRILNAGGIPILDLEEDVDSDGDELFNFIVEDAAAAEPAPRYAAFSHVWSDGLGSTTESGLPLCRIRELFRCAASLGHRFIWIDSLCVPLDRPARKQAIARMARTYELATCTVVLDRTLMAFPFRRIDTKRCGVELVLLRFITSPWMQRLWTLQEGLLSQNLVFRFKDCMVTADQLAAAILSDCMAQISPINQALARQAGRVLHAKRLHYNRPGLGDVARMLRLRSTTKTGDETLAIAGLFDVDAAELASQSQGVLRMQRFLQLLGSVPGGIVFLDGPKMDTPGWRWAPCSFLNRGSNTMSPMDMSTGKFQAGWLGQCISTGGLAVTMTLMKFQQQVSLEARDAHPVDAVVVQTQKMAIKICIGTYERLPGYAGDHETCEDLKFDGVITHPQLRRKGDVWLGMAVNIARSSSPDLSFEVQEVACARRVILRELHEPERTRASECEWYKREWIRADEIEECPLLVT